MPKSSKVYWKVPFKGRQISRIGWISISLGIEAFAVNCWSYAKQIVPVDTGSLRSSIRIVRWEGTRGKTWVRYQVLAGAGDITESGFRSIGRGGGGVGVGTMSAEKGRNWRNPYYALYVELGTRRMQAQPFMRPAFNKYKYKLRAMVRKITKEEFGTKYTKGKSSWRKKDI